LDEFVVTDLKCFKMHLFCRVWGEGAGVNYGAAAAASPAWSGYGAAASPAWSGWDPDTLWRPTGWSNSPLC